MKMLKLVEIGTHAKDTDFEGDIDTLYQIPIDNTTVMRDVYDVLVDKTEGDDYAVIALSKFIEIQDPESFDTNIFEGENIVLDKDDNNQYYMIFHLFQLKDIYSDAIEIEEVD